MNVTLMVPMEFYYWTPEGMVRERPEGATDQAAYLHRPGVEKILQEVHRQAFEAGRLQGVAESASVVRATPIRPG